MHGLHLSTKQIHVLRALFSIGITAFVAVGTYMLMRYLIGLSAY